MAKMLAKAADGAEALNCRIGDLEGQLKLKHTGNARGLDEQV